LVRPLRPDRLDVAPTLIRHIVWAHARRGMALHVRICRGCGEEYRPEIVSCADCGGELEDRWEAEEGEETTDVAPPPAATFPDADPEAELVGYLPVFAASQAPSLVPLAERLKEGGFTFRLRHHPLEPGGSPRYLLLVPEADAERALQHLAPLVDGGDEDPDRQGAAKPGEGGPERCPACQASLPAGAAECPECGLGLGDEE
jgi:hypothetical protein